MRKSAVERRMEVVDIEAIPVSVGIKPIEEPGGVAPYAGTRTEHESMERVLVRVETATGVVGWGEIHTQPSTSVAVELLEGPIGDALVGRSAGGIRSLTNDLTGTYSHYTNIGSYVGGVEVALWDALGKHHGLPVSQFFGGATTETVKFNCCLGIVDVETACEYAEWAVDAGFGLVKVKGSEDWRRDVGQLEAMHKAVDGDLSFRLDPNQGWDLTETVRVGRRLERLPVDLAYLEQPIRVDSLGEYERLRSRLGVPVAINEDAYFPRNLYEAVSRNAVDAAVIDHVMSGGLLAASRHAAVAAEANVPLAHHSSFDLGIKTAAKLHLIATTPSFSLSSDSVYYAWEDDVIEEPFSFEGSRLSVPTGPGLGVTVDESKVKEHRVD
jgi:L-alanine-DL-glutamate epimerase-like enolase superfamily enzyme